MWLIVGLGNPGNKYLLNRHNIGFMAVDAFLAHNGKPSYKSEHKATTYHLSLDDQKVILAQPQTFMNKSGESVQSLMAFYQIPKDHLIVLHDEIDQPFGALKIQKNRGHGGHNGIRSIHDLVGSNDYYRMRLGVGRPANEQMNVADFVLQNFSKEEQQEMPAYLNYVLDALDALMFEGFDKAATRFNGPYKK